MSTTCIINNRKITVQATEHVITYTVFKGPIGISVTFIKNVLVNIITTMDQNKISYRAQKNPIAEDVRAHNTLLTIFCKWYFQDAPDSIGNFPLESLVEMCEFIRVFTNMD
jgi:hypothetical protein